MDAPRLCVHGVSGCVCAWCCGVGWGGRGESLTRISQVHIASSSKVLSTESGEGG